MSQPQIRKISPIKARKLSFSASSKKAQPRYGKYKRSRRANGTRRKIRKRRSRNKAYQSPHHQSPTQSNSRSNRSIGSKGNFHIKCFLYIFLKKFQE